MTSHDIACLRPGRRAVLAGLAGWATMGKAAAATEREFRPEGAGDQTDPFSRALRDATRQGLPLRLAPGEYRLSGLSLPAGAVILGAGERTVLVQAGRDSVLVAEDATHLTLANLLVRGDRALGSRTPLLRLTGIARLDVSGIRLVDAAGTALQTVRCGGRIRDCSIEGADIGMQALDSAGLALTGNDIRRCRNNGLQVWTSTKRYDGTQVLGNRVAEIGAEAGGSGENGNGINVFRAEGVIVANNVLRGCAFSGIRANAGDNVQITGNQCTGSGEVAIFVEFGFQGAVVANNLIQGASAGISVTNFDQGGRLAAITGNVVRNVFRRPEPLTGVPNQGYGIAAEADAVLSGNVVEQAEFAGLMIGYGPFLRDVVATGNIVRQAATGIMVSVAPGAGSAQIDGNTLVGCREGIAAYAWEKVAAPDLPAAAARFPQIALGRNVVR